MKKAYAHLSIPERYQIKEMARNGTSINDIGLYLNRSKGTISMELRRNRQDGLYMPCVAQAKYQKRLHMRDGFKIDQDIRRQLS